MFRKLVQGHITVDEYVSDIKRRVHERHVLDTERRGGSPVATPKDSGGGR